MRAIGIVLAVIFLLLTGSAGLKFLLFLCSLAGLIIGLIFLFVCTPLGVFLEIFCGIMLEILLSSF